MSISDTMNELTVDLLEAARGHNAERVGKLASQYQIGPNPIDILGIRIQELVETLLGDEGRDGRQKFELRFEREISNYIDSLEQLARRSALLLPGGA